MTSLSSWHSMWESLPAPMPLGLDAALKIEPSPIPEMPIYTQKSTSLECSDADALQTVANALEMQLRPTLTVDYRPAQHKIKADAFDSRTGESCKFRVFLYRAPRADKQEEQSYVVEFQRRDGCPFLFRQVFDNVVADLAQAAKAE